jgi:hypothetical protein
MDKNGFLIGLSESERTDFGRIDFAEQPEEQKVFSAIWELESQVNNGGFEQYFSNSGGETAYFAPAALERIGAHQCAAIVSKALHTVTPDPFPQEQSRRDALLQSLTEDSRDELNDLDNDFFSYPDNLTELLFEYVRKNPKAFGPVN